MNKIFYILLCVSFVQSRALAQNEPEILEESKPLKPVFKEVERIPVKDMKPCVEGFVLWQCTFPNLTREHIEERKTALIASLVSVEFRAQEKIACVEVWFSEYLYVDDNGNLVSIIGLYFFLKEGVSPDLILDTSLKK